MGHFVPVGVYGQQVSITKGVNIGERVWAKAQRSCANARTPSAAQGIVVDCGRINQISLITQIHHYILPPLSPSSSTHIYTSSPLLLLYLE
jgi:hypothetical protein